MEKSVQPVCPHLGLKSDSTTRYSFPSIGNACSHAKGRPTPELGYQRATCLSAMHINCPVYKSPPGVKLPKNIRQPREIKKLQPKFIMWIGLVILVNSGVWLSLNYREQLFSQINRMIVPAWQQTQQALPSELPPSPTTVDFTPTHTQPVTPTATATNTPEPTPSPTITKVPAILALGVPIGSEVQFLLHRVLEGEAIGQFATRYNTTEAAIRAVNYDLPSVLFIDWILVIPLNIEDASELPAFQPIQMEEGGISVEAFARQLGVDIEDISYYNHVDPNRILQPREWILVPRE